MSLIDTIKQNLGFAPPPTGDLNEHATHSASVGRAHPRANSPLADIEVTKEYRKAQSLLDHGVPLIFVTGKAGTGKSTFINWLRHSISPKNCVVLAPTGVAALNIQGATIHSFFMLPPRVVSSSDVKRPARRRLYEKIDVLIVDEISMVRADILDAMDLFMRLNGRDRARPFGGVQVVMVGDLHQLPPVVSKGEEETVMSRRYTSTFFFSADCLRNHVLAPIELTHVFRQQDPEFVDMLNHVRLGYTTQELLSSLNSRAGVPAPDDPPTVLTTTNARADQINEDHLVALHGELAEYEASMSGKFPIQDRKPPSPRLLRLKVDSKVMFTKNDPDHRWVNGSVGTVTSLASDKIGVRMLESDGTLVDVGRVTWETFKYKYDEGEQQIVSVVVGSYTQFPLMPAWAVTIHKGQGKTLPAAIIDLGDGAFAAGQSYVALSRCRRLGDLWLARPLTSKDIFCDSIVRDFYEALFAAQTTATVESPVTVRTAARETVFPQPDESSHSAQMDRFCQLVDEAMWGGLYLQIDYVDGLQRESRRIIMPDEWVDEGRFTAFCFLRKEDRHFRLSRIRSCIPVSEDMVE